MIKREKKGTGSKKGKQKVEIAESYAKAVKDGTYGMKKYKKSSNYFGDKRKKDLEESSKRDSDTASSPR
ncbi:hypothetical protein Q1695_001026 [Nippostrongylus brasiliensis]|nr:hypothetical protein Q1695_001023 [Nippostrongylus brasiliensis]WKY16018.1 hypothetical protein Q1695_001026 [Nippostrongylus brasiliensis]